MNDSLSFTHQSELWYAWGPIELTSSNYVHMQVEYCLSSYFSIIYHYSTSLQFLLFCNLRCCDHKFAQNLFILLISIGESAKFAFLFGNNKDVNSSNRGNIFKGKNMLIFVDDGSRYFFAYDFIEDSFLTH